MARILGTRWADHLDGTEEADLIRGRGSDDTIHGGGGLDRLYGDAGNDVLSGGPDRIEAYGGRGDDQISFNDGHAYGGVGNDQIGCGGAGWSIGGKGNDYIQGSGAMWGDEGAGLPERVAGNDYFLMLPYTTVAWARGGLGNDSFDVQAHPLAPGTAVVDDFKPGEDKFRFTTTDDLGNAADLFDALDANHNGVLEWSDSLSGSQVYVDINANTMFLGYGGTWAVVHGTTQLSHASDWLLA